MNFPSKKDRAFPIFRAERTWIYEYVIMDNFFYLFFFIWIVVVEGNGGLLSSFESLPERTNRRWPIFISAISALWGTRGERCVMLVKCDLFLFLCVCICVYIYIFFSREGKREKLGEFPMIETWRNLCCNMDKHLAKLKL